MFYGAPVTASMEIPPEAYRSPFAPPTPELKELPIITDAQTTGLRLQGTLAKALPPMKKVGSMTNVRQMEAEKYAGEMAYVFDISKQQERRSRARAKANERQLSRYVKRTAKSDPSAGPRSRGNVRKEKNSAMRAAQNLTGPNAFSYLFPIR